MIPKVVTFDCAQTLVELGWHPFTAMRDCASRAGISLPDGASSRYGEMFLEWRPEYERANLTRDPAVLAQFWDRLGREWLRECGHEAHLLEPLSQAGDELAYGREGTWFRLYEDVVPTLDRLREMGIRTAVVSNWDLSLSRILRSLSLLDRFEAVIASLAEGVEKPDPALFHITLSRLGVAPEDVVHVGDNPVDDIQGAEAAGIRAFLIDRDGSSDFDGPRLTSLLELSEAF